MSTIIIKKGLESNRNTITPAEGELIYTTDQNQLYIGDGTTIGGIQLSQTASTILASIKTVDGSGSGLDADLLDGLSSANFLRSDINQNFNAQILNFANGSTVLTFDNQTAPDGRGIRRITCNDGAGNWNFKSGTYVSPSTNVDAYVNATDGAVSYSLNSDSQNGQFVLRTAPVGGITDSTITWASTLTLDNNNLTLTGANIVTNGLVDGRDVSVDGTKLDGIESGATSDQTASEILTLIKTVDGAGSGLDADRLDNLSTGAAQSSTTSHIPFIQTSGVMEVGKYLDFHNALGDGLDYFTRLNTVGGQAGELYINNTNKIWHAGNDGAGSGLDADLLDGLNSDALATASTIVSRNSVRDISARLFKSDFVTAVGTPIATADFCFRNDNGGDSFMRFADRAGLLNYLGVSGGGTDTWVSFTGAGVILNSGANVSSVTVLGTGIYQVNFVSPFASNQYAVTIGYDFGIINTSHVGYGFNNTNNVRITAEDSGIGTSSFPSISIAIRAN